MEKLPLSVVAPMHNEEGNARALYEAIRDALTPLGPYETIFVNDCSTDATLAIMKEIGHSDPRFHYLDLESNVGENWALFAGISKAAGEIIVTIDGDYQNDPSYIPAMLERLSQGYRVVSGWRRNRVGSFWDRRLPSLVANALIRMVSGVPVHDCGCGLKAYRREAIAGKYVPKGFLNRFSPVVFGVKAAEFSEVEIIDRERKAGTSHYGLGRVFEVARDLCVLRFAVSGARRWLGPFEKLQWLAVTAGAFFLILGWKITAAAAFVVALFAYSNSRSLERFIEAQARPPFRIKEYR
ncbi:MAG TPA: glycosyltransferase family 2 protein [Verrucomicrobiae bacterium]|nr:glycosyltransferase family 2 protein [Verrucomicrobiae bacterium]